MGIRINALIIVLIILILLGISIYDNEKSDDELCGKICERKGYENHEAFGVPIDCKCIDKFGDIRYERKK